MLQHHKLFLTSGVIKNIRKMSQESYIVSKYYSLVDNPDQYYILIQCFDMLEFIFRLYKTKMIFKELWLR